MVYGHILYGQGALVSIFAKLHSRFSAVNFDIHLVCLGHDIFHLLPLLLEIVSGRVQVAVGLRQKYS